VLLIGTSASYVYYARREFPHGGSKIGLGYGIAGTALILLLAFFGIRKRWYRSRFGTLEQWMQSHIYLGLLVLVILLFHTGGRFNDKIAVTTLILARSSSPAASPARSSTSRCREC
jgi:predicted ferric reductase